MVVPHIMLSYCPVAWVSSGPGSCARLYLAGLLPRNPLGKDYVEHIRKHLPILESYGFSKAVRYLREWIDGCYEAPVPLDVSACLV